MENEKDLKHYARVHSFESFGTVDGPGIRFVLFLQGCHLKCKYCHNRDTWSIHSGEYKTLDEIFDKIMRCKNYIYPRGGVTISGGEPLLQPQFIIELFKKLKKEGLFASRHLRQCLEQCVQLLHHRILVCLIIFKCSCVFLCNRKPEFGHLNQCCRRNIRVASRQTHHCHQVVIALAI